MRLIHTCLLASLIAPFVWAGPTTTEVATTRISEWGPVVDGLQVRMQSPKDVEQNAALPITLEFRSTLDSLPKGVTQLNTFLYPAHCQLRMVSVASGKQFEIEPNDPTYGMLYEDTGKSLVVLDGKSIIRLSTKIPLRSAATEIQPGEYDCTISYSTARRGNIQPHEQSGNWNGEVVSEPVRVTVIPEVMRKQTIQVPKRLTVDADGKIRFHSADAESLEIVVGNGLFLGTQISGGDGAMQLNGGPPQMDSVNTIADLSGITPGKTMSYTIKVFEAPDPPGHMWGPDESRVVWEKTFAVVAPKGP